MSVKKRVTILDIAKELNTNISTVSRALNDSKLISDSTKSAVLEAAKRLNYRPNKLASSLSSGKTHIIGVMVPSAKIEFFSNVIFSLEQVFKDAGYSIILYQSNESFESEINGIKTLLEAQVEGIIISPSLQTNDFSHLDRVKDEGKLLLVFDRVDDRLTVPMIGVDDLYAGYLGTKHLIECGYTRIAYVSTDSTIKIFEDRFEGYTKALVEFGLPIVSDYIIKEELNTEAGIKAVRTLMNLSARPDAIIGGDDFTALGIVNELNNFGITPPEIGVMGFSNQSFTEYMLPSLTTIDQQAINMGNKCAQLFLELLTLEDKIEVESPRIVLEPILIKRNSTRQV